MKRSTIDFIVGLFVLAGLLCVAYLTINLGKMDMLGGGSKYYTLSAKFKNVSGLSDGARIEIAGVQVGTVQAITLSNKGPIATLIFKLERQYSDLIDDEAIAAVKTSGLIGDKYIKIIPGSGDPIEDGGEIDDTQSAIDLEELISKYVFGGV